ncbi:MAG: caspase family protein, partial [Pyrinomonadaceae bacterium]
MITKRSIHLAVPGGFQRCWRYRRYLALCLAVALLIFVSTAVQSVASKSFAQRKSKAAAGARSSASQSRAKIKKDSSPATEQQDVSTRGLIGPPIPSFKSNSQAYALIIGISKYPNLAENAQLKFADADAQALRDFLVSDKGGFTSENVTLLLNEQGTREQIVNEIERLQNSSGPGSLALIFFAGHGVVNQSGQGFLLTSDSQLDALLNTSLEMSRFNSALQNMRSRSVVIISDACKSGAIGDLLSGPGAANAFSTLSAKSFVAPAGRRDQSSFIFSAASPSQSSIERTSLGHGIFTHHILQGLDGQGDLNGDGLVTSKELYGYVADNVGKDAETSHVKQVPEFNPFYDRSIPLAAVSEAGREKYREWFDSDPLITKLVASFDDALKEGRLIKPAGQSAYDFYNGLAEYIATPPSISAQKRKDLLAQLEAEADKVIERAPAFPNQWEEARDNLAKAFEITRDESLRAKQFYCSVMSHYHHGEIGRAERECDNTLSLIEEGQANDPLLSIRIGQFYKNLKKWEKARRAYRLAVDKKPSALWMTEYAEVLTHLNAFPEAEEQLRNALKITPNHPPALNLLAGVLLQNPQKERIAEALATVTAARLIAPGDVDTEEMYGRALMASGNPHQAVESLLKVARQSLASGTKRDRSLLYLSEAYAQSGDLSRAISALREAEERGSQSVDVYDGLARLLSERGDVEEAVSVAQKAAVMTQADGAENVKRVRMVAEYLERRGQLVEAAYKFGDAARLAPDAKMRTLFENHSRVLFLRAGRTQEAGPMPRFLSRTEKPGGIQQSPLIIPGGRDALGHLTGITINDADGPGALANVFDACLRNPAIHARLIDFYNQYPEFAKKVGRKGGGIGGGLELTPPGQTPSAETKEGLKFFGVNDKKGRREIKSKEFEARQSILRALGGDPEKLRNGESVKIKFQNDELPAVMGTGYWGLIIKDGAKVDPEQQLLAFLQDPQAMKLYVGLSAIPENATKQFSEAILSKENLSEAPAGIYFAAPYLRFTPQGDLYIPGQRQGEINWQRMLKANSTSHAVQLLFKQENGGALYLFCALSVANEVGDFIARSTGFEQIYKLLHKSPLPSAREPFDFIDLMRQLRVDGDQLRFPKTAQSWLTSTSPTGDPFTALLSKSGRIAAGQAIPLVKQMAVLSQIERERADWVANPKIVDLLINQIIANREPQIELALDLQMNEQQLVSYFALIDQIEAMQPPAAKVTVIRAVQPAFEILRCLAKNSSLDRARISELTNKLLRLQISNDVFAFQLVSFLKVDLLGADPQANGEQIQAKLIELLSESSPIEISASKQGAQPADNQPAAAQAMKAGFQFEAAKAGQDRIKRTLASQRHSKLAFMIDAVAALQELERNPSAGDALNTFKAAINGFVEPERAPQPKKKKKSKQPIIEEPTLKERVAQLTSPVQGPLLSELRSRIAPYVGEALLGQVYALLLNSVGNDPANLDLVLKHDFSTAPWSDTRVDSSGKISGSVMRLSQALAGRESGASFDGGSLAGGKDSSAPFIEAVLNSFQLVGRQHVTSRAGEYVARSIDLGEDVLALSFYGDAAAIEVINQLDNMLTPKRGGVVKALVERGEVKKAVQLLTLSELYTIGQLYLEHRLGAATAATLASEPGALGAIARVVAKSMPSEPDKKISKSLRHELSQFGMPTTSRTGLSRLELLELEPYEHAASFRASDRLLERMQDLKLGVARSSYRLGQPATLALNPT